MKSVVLQDGSQFRFISESDILTHESLPPAVYSVNSAPVIGYYLTQADPFTIDNPKIYGSFPQKAERIMNTYIDRGKSTGVLLSGIKGAGKSLLSKMVANDAIARGWPVLLINEPHHGTDFQAFMSKLTTPAVIFVDEFEKVYAKDVKQMGLLTLLDGTANLNKLFLFTVNNKYAVNEHLMCRPGRIYYMLEFESLGEDIVIEYLNDMLTNKSHTAEALRVCKAINDLSFDMLAALVEECNRYDESPAKALEMLNIKPEFLSECTYNGELSVKTSDGGTKVFKKPNLNVNVYTDWELSFYEYFPSEGHRDIKFDHADVVTAEYNKVVCRKDDAQLILTRARRHRPMSLAFGY